MLNDAQCPVFAVPKKEISKIIPSENMISPAGAEPKCIVQ
jgi:hypothetical protein